ncbi:RING-box protein 2 isoform X1 [Anser cygnoides]|uniref:RING-box protein 2 isoform X1 n=1 Tax=Anser cygnoides TaxID=8845 RepID=UPI0034D32B1D
MADVEDGDEPGAPHSHPGSSGSKAGGPDKMFSLKKWNAVAMWSWDVECDTCAICRVQVMDACLRCQAENKQEDCVESCVKHFIKEGENIYISFHLEKNEKIRDEEMRSIIRMTVLIQSLWINQQ